MKKNIILWFIYIACRCLEGSKSVIVFYVMKKTKKNIKVDNFAGTSLRKLFLIIFRYFYIWKRCKLSWNIVGVQSFCPIKVFKKT